MDLSEIAGLLGWTRVDVVSAIKDGVELPHSKARVYLLATAVGDGFECNEEQIDTFIALFENEEPGRHPPAVIRRTLLVETGHRCAVCGGAAAIQFHHILEFSRLGHHDATHMLAVCATCHVLCGTGRIDQLAQRQYKRSPMATRLLTQQNGANRRASLSAEGPLRFSWDDLRAVIIAVRNVVQDDVSGTSSKYDFNDIDLATKNRLNRMSDESFATMRDHHEPYFNRIRDFLRSLVNVDIANRYHEIVDELRMKIAAGREEFDGFGDILLRFAELAIENDSGQLKGNRKLLNVLLSFMYFNCDIGRKS